LFDFECFPTKEQRNAEREREITADLSSKAQAARYWPCIMKPRVQPVEITCEMIGDGG
jgi:hypothetical protein